MEEYFSNLSLIDLLEFVIGLITGGGLTLFFKNDSSKNEVNQSGNIADGDIAGRDNIN